MLVELCSGLPPVDFTPPESVEAALTEARAIAMHEANQIARCEAVAEAIDRMQLDRSRPILDGFCKDEMLSAFVEESVSPGHPVWFPSASIVNLRDICQFYIWDQSLAMKQCQKVTRSPHTEGDLLKIMQVMESFGNDSADIVEAGCTAVCFLAMRKRFGRTQAGPSVAAKLGVVPHLLDLLLKHGSQSNAVHHILAALSAVSRERVNQDRLVEDLERLKAALHSHSDHPRIVSYALRCIHQCCVGSQKKQISARKFIEDHSLYRSAFDAFSQHPYHAPVSFTSLAFIQRLVEWSLEVPMEGLETRVIEVLDRSLKCLNTFPTIETTNRDSVRSFLNSTLLVFRRQKERHSILSKFWKSGTFTSPGYQPSAPALPIEHGGGVAYDFNTWCDLGIDELKKKFTITYIVPFFRLVARRTDMIEQGHDAVLREVTLQTIANLDQKIDVEAVRPQDSPQKSTVQEACTSLLFPKMNFQIIQRYDAEVQSQAVDKLLAKAKKFGYTWESFFLDTVWPTADLCLDISGLATYILNHQYNFTAVVTCAMVFNGYTTSRRFYHDPYRGKTWKLVLNFCSGGLYYMLEESALCSETGVKTENLNFLKEIEAAESATSLFVASYSILIAGFLPHEPAISTTSLITRCLSLASSLFTLPKAIYEISEKNLTRYARPGEDRELYRINSQKTWTLPILGKLPVGQIRMVAFHVSEIWAILILLPFALATRPYGIFCLMIGQLILFLFVTTGFIVEFSSIDAQRRDDQKQELFTIAMLSLVFNQYSTEVFEFRQIRMVEKFIAVLRLVVLAVAWAVSYIYFVRNPEAADMFYDYQTCKFVIPAVAAVGGVGYLFSLPEQLMMSRWSAGDDDGEDVAEASASKTRDGYMRANSS